ncbi:MAG: class II glutamine amidotransferase [Gammaproteobacteria bacterium]|nr:class II glutamine amidotransferase [Gammaproteobacteria bacterium]
MCRFTFYKGKPLSLSALLTVPEHSLIHQSFHALERDEPLNGDGFGVAWYSEGHDEPALFRSVTPAWSNQNLRELARVTASPCVLAHVRAATQGLQVGEPNCHPFRRGRLAFMHNGDIGGFAAIRRALLDSLSDAAFESIRGTTDSEHFFALLSDELAREGDTPGSAAMASALRRAVTRVLALTARHAPAEHIYLNAVLTDGQAAVACRFTTDAPEAADSLYTNRGRRYVCEGSVCRMLDPGEANGSAVMISSEPLSGDNGWEAVPVNHLVRVEPNLNLATEPMAA